MQIDNTEMVEVGEREGASLIGRVGSGGIAIALIVDVLSHCIREFFKPFA